MKTRFKGIAFALTAAILFSLCLTPEAFATEESFAAASSDAEGIREKVELLTATPSNAEKVKAFTATPSNAEKVKAFTATPSDAVEDTVSTGEELMEWLSGHKDTGGAVKLADDIFISDFYYARDRGAAAVTVDTGSFSITADGYVYLQATSPLMIRGLGGEKGVLRSSGEGSMLHLNGLVLGAENGFAVFQEEGTGFIVENTSISGDAHYAKQPFVCEWKPVLTVVNRGKALDVGMLPSTLSARVNRQGQVTDYYEEVPVTWEPAGYGEDQKLRRRFTMPGVFGEMASQTVPVCVVVYDDFPLTFLEVNVKKMAGKYGDSYRLNGTFSKPEDRLPITVAQEYSFDGQKWTVYGETTVTTPNSGFSISLFVGEEELETVSKLFIRLRWNDDGNMYYSNVLRFDVDSLEANEEPGGNRGGGTDIIDPPGPPETDPAPETVLPPVTSPSAPGLTEQGGTDHEAGGNGDGEDVFSESSGDGHGGAKEPLNNNAPKPGPSTGPSDSGPGQPLSVPEPQPNPASEPAPSPSPEPVSKPSPVPVSEPALSGDLVILSGVPPASVPEPDAPSSAEDSVEILAKPEPEPAPQRADVFPIVSIAAGFTAVAACMAIAALYLHPKVREKLLRGLRNIMKH